MKASDKQDLCRKIITLLKPRYGSPSKKSLPVLETMLYAVCLEGVPPDRAEQAYSRLLSEFHDLNEVRVSSIYELERLFTGYADPDLRGLRVKNVLHYVFEKTYSFEFEVLRRKTQEQAQKDLAKIRSLTSFCRAYTQQISLDSHVLPLDEKQAQALKYLGVAEPNATVDHISESLRPLVRKADAQLFCHLLRCVSTDPEFVPTFAELPEADDTRNAIQRLQEVLTGTKRSKKKEKADAHPPAKASKASQNGKSPAKAPANAKADHPPSKKPAPPPARAAKAAPKKK
jgi:hypothetical protein